VRCSNDNWDAAFVENWTSADLVDCIYAFAITQIVAALSAEGAPRPAPLLTPPPSSLRLTSRPPALLTPTLTLPEAAQKGEAGAMLARLQSDPRVGKQFLVLAHLYARTDAATLAALRHALSRRAFTAPAAAAGVAALGAAAAAGVAALSNRREFHASTLSMQAAVERAAPFVADRPLVCAAAAAAALGAAWWSYGTYVRARSLERAAALQSHVRVVKRRPVAEVAALLDGVFTGKDTVDTIRCAAPGLSHR